MINGTKIKLGIGFIIASIVLICFNGSIGLFVTLLMLGGLIIILKSDNILETPKKKETIHYEETYDDQEEYDDEDFEDYDDFDDDEELDEEEYREKLKNDYGLSDEEIDDVINEGYDPASFEEDGDLEDDDYYYEDK